MDAEAWAASDGVGTVGVFGPVGVFRAFRC
jgi:hypothetical protein